jgi:hypothetical protein
MRHSLSASIGIEPCSSRIQARAVAAAGTNFKNLSLSA